MFDTDAARRRSTRTLNIFAMRKIFVLVLFLLAFIQSSYALDPDCLRMHGDEWCEDSERLSTEYDTVDKQINSLYKSLMSKLNDKQKKSVRDSQRAWLQYQRMECTARIDMMDGGDAVMRNNVWTGCVIDFYKSRIKDLKTEFCSSVGGC